MYEGRRRGLTPRIVEDDYEYTEEGMAALREAGYRAWRLREARRNETNDPFAVKPKQLQLVSAQYAGGRVRLSCQHCGKSFTRIPSQVRRGSTKYCSYECFMADRNHQRGEDNPAWRGGHDTYYGPDWRPMQRAARQRDGHACVRCGATREDTGRELDVHHLRPVGDFDEPNDANTLDNLVTLCHSCHMYVEWNGFDCALPERCQANAEEVVVGDAPRRQMKLEYARNSRR